MTIELKICQRSYFKYEVGPFKCGILALEEFLDLRPLDYAEQILPFSAHAVLRQNYFKRPGIDDICPCNRQESWNSTP